MTFSVVGRSADGESWGVAVASKFLAVGAVVPAATAGVGAVATQADANVAWKAEALRLLGDGVSADEVVRQLVADDPGAAERQLGVVDAGGSAATHTGADCLDWAGGIAAPGVAVQGNILAGPQVVEAMKQAWDAAADLPLAHRLLAVLAAGDAAGGDRRGRQSAALLVVRPGAGYGGGDDIAAAASRPRCWSCGPVPATAEATTSPPTCASTTTPIPSPNSPACSTSTTST